MLKSFPKEQLEEELEQMFSTGEFSLLSKVFARKGIFEQIRDNKLESRFVIYGMMMSNEEWHQKYVDAFYTGCYRVAYGENVLRRLMEEIGNNKIHSCVEECDGEMAPVENHHCDSPFTNDDVKRGIDEIVIHPTRVVDVIKTNGYILEYRITSFDNLRTVETEKRNKYDYLANHCGQIYKAKKTTIIPYVMTWEGVVTKYHEQYCKELGIDQKTEAYVQTKEMTFESMCIMRRTTNQGV